MCTWSSRSTGRSTRRCRRSAGSGCSCSPPVPASSWGFTPSGSRRSCPARRPGRWTSTGSVTPARSAGGSCPSGWRCGPWTWLSSPGGWRRSPPAGRRTVAGPGPPSRPPRWVGRRGGPGRFGRGARRGVASGRRGGLARALAAPAAPPRAVPDVPVRAAAVLAAGPARGGSGRGRRTDPSGHTSGPVDGRTDGRTDGDRQHRGVPVPTPGVGTGTGGCADLAPQGPARHRRHGGAGRGGARRAAVSGVRCLTAVPGDRIAETGQVFDLAAEDGYGELATALAGCGLLPDAVIHARTPQPSGELARDLELGLYSFLALRPRSCGRAGRSRCGRSSPTGRRPASRYRRTPRWPGRSGRSRWSIPGSAAYGSSPPAARRRRPSTQRFCSPRSSPARAATSRCGTPTGRATAAAWSTPYPWRRCARWCARAERTSSPAARGRSAGSWPRRSRRTRPAWRRGPPRAGRCRSCSPAAANWGPTPPGSWPT